MAKYVSRCCGERMDVCSVYVCVCVCVCVYVCVGVGWVWVWVCLYLYQYGIVQKFCVLSVCS